MNKMKLEDYRLDFPLSQKNVKSEVRTSKEQNLFIAKISNLKENRKIR